MIGLDKARPARPAKLALTISRFSRFSRFPFPPCIVFPVLISHDTPVRRKIAGSDGGYPAICVRSCANACDFRFFLISDMFGPIMCEDACGVVRSLRFFFYFSSDLFRPLSLSLSPPLCARVCVHVVCFFSPPHGAESHWLPGSPGTDDSFIRSFILSVFGRFVGVWVWVCLRVLFWYHVTVDPGWLVVFFGLVRAAAARNSQCAAHCLIHRAGTTHTRPAFSIQTGRRQQGGLVLPFRCAH